MNKRIRKKKQTQEILRVLRNRKQGDVVLIGDSVVLVAPKAVSLYTGPRIPFFVSCEPIGYYIKIQGYGDINFIEQPERNLMTGYRANSIIVDER